MLNIRLKACIFSLCLEREFLVKAILNNRCSFTDNSVFRGPVLMCTSVGYIAGGGVVLYHSSGSLTFSPPKFELEPPSLQERFPSFCKLLSVPGKG